MDFTDFLAIIDGDLALFVGVLFIFQWFTWKKMDKIGIKNIDFDLRLSLLERRVEEDKKRIDELIVEHKEIVKNKI